jgi:hypothetical protein
MRFYVKGHIGHNLEVYVANIIVKSQKKCTFEVPQGKLLGYIIIERSIEANPDKISAIIEMGQVKNVKDV